MSSIISKSAPGAVPANVREHFEKFGHSARSWFTTSSHKIDVSIPDGRVLMLMMTPARLLSQQITPGVDGATPSRSFIPELFDLAERHGLTGAAMAFNSCPRSTAGCAMGCLTHSGHGGLGITVPAARGRRTLAFLADPSLTARATLWAIGPHYRAARKAGETLAVRLNGTSDLPWHSIGFDVSPSEVIGLRERYGIEIEPGSHTLPEILRGLDGAINYEYSKHAVPVLKKMRAAGVDVTASFAADRDNGCHEAIEALRHGFRIAVPVDIAKGDAIPAMMTISSATDTVRVPCVDGDKSDHRYLDGDSVAVILRTKNSRGADHNISDKFTLRGHESPQDLADGLVFFRW